MKEEKKKKEIETKTPKYSPKKKTKGKVLLIKSDGGIVVETKDGNVKLSPVMAKKFGDIYLGKEISL